MTDKKFTELVNLYLDKEISQRELAELKAELTSDSERKAEFQERCRLHQAMKMALSPQATKESSARRRSGRSSKRRSSSAPGSSRSGKRRSRSRRSERRISVSSSSRIDPHFEEAHRARTFPKWILGAGLAASLLVALVLLPSVFRDTTDVGAMASLEGVDPEELEVSDPLDEIGRAELRRFASIQAQRAANQRASLAAQLRLMGLRPELTPEEKELRSVSLAALQPKAPRRNQAELLEELQKLSPIPTPRILSKESLAPDTSPRWPSGFQSSLASFK